MAGCAVGVLPTGLPRISPEIQGKKQGEKQGENCLSTGTCLWQCAGPQFPAGLLFPVWNVPVWNRPAVGGQGTGIARVLATGPTGCQPRLCRPDIPGRRFTPRPACLPADHPCIKPQTEPDRRAGLPDRKRGARGTGQDGGQGRAVHGVVPGLASQVALQGGPVRHMSIRSSATGIPTSVRMKPGVAQFPRPGPEQIPVPGRMSDRPVVSNNIRGALLIRETGQPDAGQHLCLWSRAYWHPLSIFRDEGIRHDCQFSNDRSDCDFERLSVFPEPVVERGEVSV